MSDTESEPSAYDEDEIVSLITDMYKLLLQLGHMAEQDIIWAPPEGHAIDTSKLDPNVHIDDRVRSLMRRLPAPRIPWPRFALCGDMRAIDYRHPEYLANSRDIDKAGPHSPVWTSDQSNCRSTDMLLLDQMSLQSSKLVLCTAENVVRVVEIGHSNEGYFKNLRAAREQGDTGPDYLLFPPENASSYLARELDCLLTGERIPDFVGGFCEASSSDVAEDVQCKLTNEYNWPGSEFRRDDWLRNGPAMVNAVQHDWEQRQRLATAEALPEPQTSPGDVARA